MKMYGEGLIASFNVSYVLEVMKAREWMGNIYNTKWGLSASVYGMYYIEVRVICVSGSVLWSVDLLALAINK